MVDHGANEGLAGSDMRVLHKTHRKINIQGIDNHEVTGLDVVTDATLLNTSQGKVIGIFNEYAYLGKGSSIHSSGQLELFQTNVDETSGTFGGTQLITTLDGYSVPPLITDGLAYATSLGRPTDQDMDTYLHVFDMFLSMFRLCSCGTKPQRSENHHFVMMSSWEPQCHHDIIMRTPRITGKPKFSRSGGP